MSSTQKAIFFDIDGTIFDVEERIVPEKTISAIKKARRNGHLCFINTGRTRTLVDPLITDWVKFDGLLMGCGTMVTYGKKTLLHQSFDRLVSEKIIEKLYEYRIDAILEGSDELYFMRPDEYHYEVFQNYASKYIEENHLYLDSAVGKFDKFFAYTEHKEDMNKYIEEFQGILDVVDRERGYYEILPQGYSKASAIEFIAKKLHIPMENTVAIGDSNNDLAMLEMASTAIAMKKSSQKVLEIADYITGDAADNGINEALEWLGVI